MFSVAENFSVQACIAPVCKGAYSEMVGRFFSTFFVFKLEASRVAPSKCLCNFGQDGARIVAIPPALRLAWQATQAQPVTRECFDSLYAGSVQAAGTSVAYFQIFCFLDFWTAEPASFPVFAVC